MLSRLFSWLTGQPIEPTVRQTNLQVLRIPADGSSPHLVQLNSIESDDNIDCCQLHIPDFRPYWGNGEGFQWRDIIQMEVRDQQAAPELNGVYFGWKSFALDLMPLSKHTGFCGDAFFAKSPLWENDENGVVYEDVPVSFLGSSLLEAALEKLHDR